MQSKLQIVPFYQAPKEVTENTALKAIDRFCFIMLFNRKRLSTTNGKDYFDKNHNDYFVIYSQEEMAVMLDVSSKTVGRIYKRLEEAGLIEREKFTNSFNAPDKIFAKSDFVRTSMTKKDSEHENLSSPEQTKRLTSNSDINNNKLSDNNTINTINTGKKAKKDEKISCSKTSIEKWIHAVNDKLNLDTSVIEAILQVTQYEYKKAHKLVGIILNAKKNIVKTFKMGANNPVTRFETNNNLSTPLADKIRHIFDYAPIEPNQNEKYLMAGFKNFFRNAFGLESKEKQTPEMISEEDVIMKMEDNKLAQFDNNEGPDIPLFNIITGQPFVPNHLRGWTTTEDIENGPEIPIFKIQ